MMRRATDALRRPCPRSYRVGAVSEIDPVSASDDDDPWAEPDWSDRRVLASGVFGDLDLDRRLLCRGADDPPDRLVLEAIEKFATVHEYTVDRNGDHVNLYTVDARVEWLHLSAHDVRYPRVPRWRPRAKHLNRDSMGTDERQAVCRLEIELEDKLDDAFAAADSLLRNGYDDTTAKKLRLIHLVRAADYEMLDLLDRAASVEFASRSAQRSQSRAFIRPWPGLVRSVRDDIWNLIHRVQRVLRRADLQIGVHPGKYVDLARERQAKVDERWVIRFRALRIEPADPRQCADYAMLLAAAMSEVLQNCALSVDADVFPKGIEHDDPYIGPSDQVRAAAEAVRQRIEAKGSTNVYDLVPVAMKVFGARRDGYLAALRAHEQAAERAAEREAANKRIREEHARQSRAHFEAARARGLSDSEAARVVPEDLPGGKRI